MFCYNGHTEYIIIDKASDNDLTRLITFIMIYMQIGAAKSLLCVQFLNFFLTYFVGLAAHVPILKLRPCYTIASTNFTLKFDTAHCANTSKLFVSQFLLQLH